MSEFEKNAFAPGAFVVLHHRSYVGDNLHPDAGRIGKIVSCRGQNIVVELFKGDGSSRFLIGIPKRHFAPMPDFMVEEYRSDDRTDDRTGYRLNEKGIRIATGMEWAINDRTKGVE